MFESYNNNFLFYICKWKKKKTNIRDQVKTNIRDSVHVIIVFQQLNWLDLVPSSDDLGRLKAEIIGKIQWKWIKYIFVIFFWFNRFIFVA